MRDKTKNWLFRFLLLLLMMPFFQGGLRMVTTLRLWGDFTNAPDVYFSWNDWWSGTYQQQKNNYFNDQVGFRQDLVRINNQVDYSLFKKLHSNSVVLGSNQCLYQKDYINAYYGRDFVGADKILTVLIKLKAVQDTLTKLGKTVILAHAPCKAFFYPDDFPDDLKGPHVAPSNYQAYVRIADSLGINQIDYNSWFLSMKDRRKELLYSKQGIHWTVYGSLLAADSLISYVEKKRNIHMPHIYWTKTDTSSRARETDDDIYKALNLILPITRETFTYPDVKFSDDSTKTKPKVIYIGDSFISNFIHDRLMEHTNSDWEYWFYFNVVAYQNSGDDPATWRHIEDYDWMDKIKHTDCILIMYTSHNLFQLGNGFIERTYDYFYPAKK